MRILADGRTRRCRGGLPTPLQLLDRRRHGADTYDEGVAQRQRGRGPASARQTVQQMRRRAMNRGFAWESVRTEPLQVRIYRSVPVMHEG